MILLFMLFFCFSFISTLVTAVLTHHLGWVATALPPSEVDKEFINRLDKPYNALWGQLTDLYGAVGHPTKMAHTIITGTNKAELISKILNSLTYFIRCSDIERKCGVRCDIKSENDTADSICCENSCIPKEYYKKYEDHLREMSAISSFNKCGFQRKSVEYKKNGMLENIELNCFKNPDKSKLFDESNLLSNVSLEKKTGLVKTQTCITDLSKNESLYPNLETLCTQELADVKMNALNSNESNHANHTTENPKNKSEEFNISNSELHEKVNKLLRVPTSAIEYHLQNNQQGIRKIATKSNINFLAKTVNMEKQMKCNDSILQVTNSVDNDTRDIKKDVIFVLGDDEKLVGLKKGKSCIEFNNYGKENPVEDTKVSSDEKFVSRGLKKEKSCFDFKNYVDKISDDMETKTDPFEACSGDSVSHNNTLENKENTITVPEATKQMRPTFLNICSDKSVSTLPHVCKNETCSDIDADKSFETSEFKESHFTKCKWKPDLKSSLSWASLNTAANNIKPECSGVNKEPPKKAEAEFVRSQSVPPEESKPNSSNIDLKAKYRYSGVKFNFQQYPQIVTNYMKSKNIELSNLPFSEKKLEGNQLVSLEGGPSFDFSNCDGDGEEVEALQTPSNASELECISDLITEKNKDQHAKETVEKQCKSFIRTKVPSTVLRDPIMENDGQDSCSNFIKSIDNISSVKETEGNDSCCHAESCKEAKQSLQKMKIVYLPMPKYVF